MNNFRKMKHGLLGFFVVLTIVGLTGMILAAGKFPVTIKDQFNRTVKIDKAPLRIVSGSPSNTEILFALGLEQKVVGVTNWCNYPQAAQKVAKIGDISPLNVEKVLSLQPDLFIASNLNGEEAIAKLSELGVPVVAMNPMSFAQTLESITLIGKATGKDDQAQAVVNKLKNTIKQVQKQGEAIKKRGLKVFILLGWEPYWTAGPGSFLEEAVNLTGGENIAHDLGQSWGQMNFETVLSRNPDVIITDIDPEKLYSDKSWGGIAAIEKHQVYKIVGDEYYRPGPRLIEALNDLVSLMAKSR